MWPYIRKEVTIFIRFKKIFIRKVKVKYIYLSISFYIIVSVYQGINIIFSLSSGNFESQRFSRLYVEKAHRIREGNLGSEITIDQIYSVQ